MEQHEPCGQLPQTVLPFAAPHDPSVVTFPVATVLVVGLPKTGSCEVFDPAFWVEVPPVEVQPLWQPAPQLRHINTLIHVLDFELLLTDRWFCRNSHKMSNIHRMRP